jgi:hypothetical protein
MALTDDVRKLVGVADRLKGPVANEANTKALLIEPMLSALGWDTTSLDHVLRDWTVHDSSSIDYALRIDESNAMLVEARAVSESLDDQSFTARVVDSVNADGVLWCVLTNGLIYRVYRTDELVPTEQKLSFEVDLAKVAVGSPADCANLPLLRRESLADGSLALWGEQKVFTDPRVRQVLAQLAAMPSPAFIDAINEAIGEHKVTRERLRASLGRVLVIDTSSSGATRAASAASAASAPAAPRDTPAAPPETPRVQEIQRPSGASTAPAQAPFAPPPARPEAAPPRPDASATPAEAPARPPAPATPAMPARSETPTRPQPPTLPEPARAPEAAQAAPPAEAPPAQESSRRRFLGGQAKAPRDTSAERELTDPYAPLSPFDESDS